MPAIRSVMAICLVAAALGACAGAGPLSQGGAGYQPAAGPAESGTAALKPASLNDPPGASAGHAAYVLSPEEHDFDCKRLAGKVQIRILELRSALQRDSSALSRTMQAAGASVFGGSRRGTDPGGERAHDIAMVEAYNRELVNKDCRSFDLDQALASTDAAPTPTVPARSPR